MLCYLKELFLGRCTALLWSFVPLNLGWINQSYALDLGTVDEIVQRVAFKQRDTSTFPAFSASL